MWRAVPDIVADFEGDPEVRVIVLTGAGERAFVSGADISEFEAKRSAEENIKIYDAAGEAAHRALIEATKPTVAMIRGICIGGGVAIALNTDVRICSANSVFSVPAAKLGLGYKYPGIKRLVDIVGPAFAKEIFFSANKFTAEDARIMGLVNRVVPEPELESYVRTFASTIGANAPLTIKAAKMAINAAVEDPERRRDGGNRRGHQGLLCQRGLHRGPPRLHGKAQGEVQGPLSVRVHVCQARPGTEASRACV